MRLSPASVAWLKSRLAPADWRVLVERTSVENRAAALRAVLPAALRAQKKQARKSRREFRAVLKAARSNLTPSSAVVESESKKGPA